MDFLFSLIGKTIHLATMNEKDYWCQYSDIDNITNGVFCYIITPTWGYIKDLYNRIPFQHDQIQWFTSEIKYPLIISLKRYWAYARMSS